MKQIISLDGAWRFYYAPNREVKKALPFAILTEESLQALGYPSVAATVPGNFELDLCRGGVIGEPFYASNIIALQKYENTHLFYVRHVTCEALSDARQLIFEGIDTVADIWINGILIGSCDNMLIPHAFSGEALRIGQNEIIVHITPSCIAARKKQLPVSAWAFPFNYDSLSVRHAPHASGWDIMPRAVTGGIWRTCRIESVPDERIDGIFFWSDRVDPKRSRARLNFFWNLTVEGDDLGEYSLLFEGECNGHVFSHSAPIYHTDGQTAFFLEEVRLWYPHNYGEANLYDVRVSLLCGGKTIDVYAFSAGIRTVELERTSLTDRDGNGEFLIRVNGQKIFCMGTNWVPVDAYHSRDRERLPKILPMLSELGCNIVRCWGGNVYEDDLFYDYCDRHGILVWQDFSHGCSIDSQTEDALRAFSCEVESVVKRLRNHPSVAVWAGDNEVDLAYGWSNSPIPRDPNKNLLTRGIIPYQLSLHDFTRPYLPSSPYIDEAAFYAKYHGGALLSEDHLWGPRDDFKGEFYSTSVCHFASETGYHGCPSPASLARFIRPEQLDSWRKYPDNDRISRDDWTTHASCAALDGKDGNDYRIPLMVRQVASLFPHEAEFDTLDGLSRFSMASQISQAEAKKYFIERFRLSKWRRTGIIWWNLIDGWPQISDAVVDYYFTKKLAYHYIKASQMPLCLMLDEPCADARALIAANDLQSDAVLHYTVTDAESGACLLTGEGKVSSNSTCVLGELPVSETPRFYIIRWNYEYNGSLQTGQNHYVTHLKNLELEQYLSWMQIYGTDSLFEGFAI